MKTILLIAGKDLRQRLRDRSAYLQAIVLPLALAFIYNLIFGSAATPRPFEYAVADLDRGLVSQAFTNQVLPSIEQDGYIKIRLVGTREEAASLAKEGTVDAAFVVQQGFPSTAGIDIVASPDSPTGVEVARSIARSFVSELNAVQLAVAATKPGDATQDELVQRALATASPLLVRDISAQEKILSLQTYFAAGMAVFFLFFTVQYGVSSILDERNLGTLVRLLAAPIPARTILAGKLATSFLLGLISMALLVVATSLLMGAEWGDPAGVALLIICGILAATGVTAVVASLARTPESAGSWQAVTAVVLGLLGGAFFPISQVGGIMSTLSLLTPHAWFLRGLSDMAGGASALAVLPSAAALLAFAAATIGIAVIRLSKVLQP
ncbi:ABC transporter permease [Catelliglobosispora koreensis]|uniref:ABC transporter permease n=1 Tax=Catelliglobosispora koreensis TaxID=129052 RepID=UPI00036A3923|nr:ABC transporter permease [Catelliglobosispora koreensis]